MDSTPTSVNVTMATLVEIAIKKVSIYKCARVYYRVPVLLCNSIEIEGPISLG